ncbi:MAG TPA: ATP-binding cassette domain-containing protein [Mycobacteriales bacterium]|nr:ATP-binding cassette domain-containing protein [Mycobacteriales bacterium]
MAMTEGADGSPHPTGPLLAVRSVSAQYGARRVLTGVDLEVRAGEVLALAGENGAGKSTLVRCIAGDLTPSAGEIELDGERVRLGPGELARRGVAVVWQDLALCDNLDVASNLLLGRERWRSLLSEARFHAEANALLTSLGIPLIDTTRSVASLSGGQRQLVAVARAMRERPRLLVLDEPTASLGVFETAQVESLARRLSDDGTTILLVTHDVDQMFRLADRITVLRHGQMVADLPTGTSHPDEIVSLISGQPVDSSPRRQLDRLHSLVGRLTHVDPASSLAVILSALGTALAADRLCIHLLDAGRLRLTAAVGLPDDLLSAWSDLPIGAFGGPAGQCAQSAEIVIDADVRGAPTWSRYREIAERAAIRSSWAVPVNAGGGLLGVITVFRRTRGTPHHDELDLVSLYAGYAASTAERDGLLGEVTARNRVLETVRVVLEQLAVSVPLSAGLDRAVDALRVGLGADEVGLLGPGGDEPVCCRGWSGTGGESIAATSPLLRAYQTIAGQADRRLGESPGRVRRVDLRDSIVVAAHVPAPGEPLVLLASWPVREAAAAARADTSTLLEDAARSVQLALERETSERAHREAAALRRSQELQRDFLAQLSHELRTPLTAIHGYADSLMQTDVTWDAASQSRFLARIAAESARLSRLVGDLLDLSAIDSNLLRLHPDWCDVALILDAARACLPMQDIGRVKIECEELPAVWADHDRLEQVLVNLIDNAVRHNEPETTVHVVARMNGPHAITITVSDDGAGMPDPGQSVGLPVRAPTAGAGLGLSIAKAIVAAHHGTITLDSLSLGTRWRIELPVVGDAESEFAVSGAPDG